MHTGECEVNGQQQSQVPLNAIDSSTTLHTKFTPNLNSYEKEEIQRKINKLHIAKSISYI